MQTSIEKFPQRFCPYYPLYTMKGQNGLAVSILPLGAVIQKIAVSDEEDREIFLNLGFSKLEPYTSLSCYAGAALGPNAGRIRGGQLSLLGVEYTLTANDGEHQSHGGRDNLSSQIWTVENFVCKKDTASLLMRTCQSHGSDGWPGDRTYQVRYTLTDHGCFTIEYKAWSDRPTYFNLSNHTYWNLSGNFNRSALDQELTICASQVCVNDIAHLPVRIMPVDGTAFDFRKGRTLDDAIQNTQDPVGKEQLAIAQGFNHAYLLDEKSRIKRACILRDQQSGRGVELWTDAPGVVLYSGGFLPDGIDLHDGQRSTFSCAIALEAQDLPDCSHLYPAAFRPTLPGEIWHRIIQFRFHLPK